MPTLVEMRNITKTFPGVVANDGANFTLESAEIHALLGENGAGKTTLMNVLYGLYPPDAGTIRVEGQEARIGSPADAIRLGVGMVHQHFMLIPPLSVVENITLGIRSPREPFLDLARAEVRIRELASRYGLEVDPRARVWQLSVGEQQRVEILKALYRGARVLILDEPTSVLTPQEVKRLFEVLAVLVEQGLGVIFISHKLDEVMKASSRVTVLKNGRVVASRQTATTNPAELARMMLGREVIFQVARQKRERGAPVLEVEGVEALNDRGLAALRSLSLTVHSGEILGLAGVDGNGQTELAESITGLRKVRAGRVRIRGDDFTHRPTEEIFRAGVALIPEDRQRTGLIGDFTLAENLILETHGSMPFARAGWQRRPVIDRHSEELLGAFDVRPRRKELMAYALSGGNQQKLILARQVARRPVLLVACQPTHGLDIGATEYVRRELLTRRDDGMAILLISTDLEELLALSDRLAVIYRGEILEDFPIEEAEMERIGLLMGGHRGPALGRAG
ncbi:MAG: ABC transporter ATP-binding protein [Nitrospinota bacterium]